MKSSVTSKQGLYRAYVGRASHEELPCACQQCSNKNIEGGSWLVVIRAPAYSSQVRVAECVHKHVGQCFFGRVEHTLSMYAHIANSQVSQRAPTVLHLERTTRNNERPWCAVGRPGGEPVVQVQYRLCSLLGVTLIGVRSP